LSAAVIAGVSAARDQAPRGPSVTFSKDVAPIFQQKCQVCHQPNSIAPMTLVNYGDAKRFASAIKTKVAARVMPPWHVDKNIGVRAFKNDRSLTDEQINTIVSGRCRRTGDPKDLPPP
jgi:hypothetical protein